MHYNFAAFCPRVTSEFWCCSVVCDDIMLVPAAAADGLSGRASSPHEEISWMLRFPLPLSSHNILPLLQFTAIHIRTGEKNKTGCCNILWGFWRNPTSVLRRCWERGTLLCLDSFLSCPTWEQRDHLLKMEGSETPAQKDTAGKDQVDRMVLLSNKPLHRFVKMEPKTLGVTGFWR